MEDASGTGIFAIMNPELNDVGPVGYIELANTSRIDQNGVILLSGQIPGQRQAPLTAWGYGDLFPARYNENDNARAVYFDFTYPRVRGGQIGVINVVKPGGLTSLELRVTVSGTTYRLAADLDSGQVIAQLKVGLLLSGNNRTPKTNTAVWRINLTGDQTGMEIYVGVVRYPRYLFD